MVCGMLFSVITPFAALMPLYIHIRPLEGLGQLTLYMFMLDPFVSYVFGRLTGNLLLDLTGRFALLILIAYVLAHTSVL